MAGVHAKRLDPARLLLAAGLLLLILELGLATLLLQWPEPPFELLPGQQLTDSKAR